MDHRGRKYGRWGGHAAPGRASARVCVLGLTTLAFLPGSGLLASQDLPAPEPSDVLEDPRWAAFVGCWEPVAGPDLDGEAVDEPAEGLLCIRPEGRGVEMFTVVAGTVETSDLLVADGSPRTVQGDGCEGWESVTFSSDGRRAFTRSEYTCGALAQTGTGVLALVSPTEWVDVRALEVDGERTSWVQRYALVGGGRAAREGLEDPGFGMEAAARAARFVAHHGVGFPQIEEAALTVDAEAVAGWLAYHPGGLEPTADDLERLADAGVPGEVIDVVVAVSYPETFQVDPEADFEASRRDASTGYAGDGYRSRAYYGGFRPYGFRSFGFGFGYGAPGLFFGPRYGHPGYWGYRRGPVVIERRAPDRGGRAVPGRGYTRGSGEGRNAAPLRGPDDDGGRAGPRAGSDLDRDDDERPRRRARPRRPGPGGGPGG